MNSNEDQLVQWTQKKVAEIADQKGYDISDFQSIGWSKAIIDIRNEFNLPISYSWYLFGHTVRKENRRTEVTGSDAFNYLVETEKPEIISENEDQIEEYIREDLDLEGLTETGDWIPFLRNLYEDVDDMPEKYKNLYLNNLKIQDVLNSLQTKNNQWIKTNSDKLLDKTMESVSKMQIDISQYEEFEEVKDKFIMFTNLLEEVLANINDDDFQYFRGDQKEVIEDIQDFYIYEAWRLLAAIIAQNEPRGPNSEEEKEYYIYKEKTAKEEYKEEFNDLREKCKKEGLLLEGSVDLDVNEESKNEFRDLLKD